MRVITVEKPNQSVALPSLAESFNVCPQRPASCANTYTAPCSASAPILERNAPTAANEQAGAAGDACATRLKPATERPNCALALVAASAAFSFTGVPGVP